MRFAFIAALSLLIQMGLFGRVMHQASCCPDAPPAHCHDHEHSHDSDHDPSSDSDKTHHHHASCIHSIPLSFSSDCDHRSAPMYCVSIERILRHERAPDGPVMEMDKPPLI
jgi:hypothetical protein